MGAVFEAVSDGVSAVGDTISHAVDAVADRAEKLVEDIGKDPVSAIAVVSSVVFPPAAPFIMAGNAIAHGATLEQAVTAGAVSYVGGQVGNYVGTSLSTAAEQAAAAAQYGVSAGGQQAALLAAQEAGMGTLAVDRLTQAAIGSTASGASGAARATLLGGSPAAGFSQGFVGSATQAGADAAIGAAGNAVDGWLQDITAKRDVNGAIIPGTGVSTSAGAAAIGFLIDPERAAAKAIGGEFGLSGSQVDAGLGQLSQNERMNAGLDAAENRANRVSFQPTRTNFTLTGPGNVNENSYAANGYEDSWYDSIGGAPNNDNLSSSLLKYLDTIGQSPVGNAASAAQKARTLQRRPNSGGQANKGSVSSMLGGSYAANQANGFDSFADWAADGASDEQTQNRFYG